MPALCPQYFAFLVLILIAQVAAGVLFYFNMGKVSSPHPHPRPATQGGGQTRALFIVTEKPRGARAASQASSSLWSHGRVLEEGPMWVRRVAAGPRS